MVSLRTLTPIVKWLIIAAVFVIVAGLSAYFTVNLLVGSQDTVVVPDLVGKDVVWALEVLSDLGLNTKVEGVKFDSEIPKNHVIFQHPQAGSQIKKGRDVRLVLSKGPSTVSVPRLAGVPLIKGRIILEENGLCTGKITRAYDCDLPRETILAQYPPPSSTVERGSCLDLLVSLGPPPVTITMVDVTGTDLSRAMVKLDAARLSLGSIKTVFNPDLADGKVIRQVPSPGYPVVAGSAVDLVVNRHQKRKGSTAKPGISLFRYRAPQGFLNQHVKVLESRPGITITLFDGYLEPGQSIWLLIDRAQPATVSLYLDGELSEMEFFD